MRAGNTVKALVAFVLSFVSAAHASAQSPQPQGSPSPTLFKDQVIVEADRAKDGRDPVSFTDLNRETLEASHRGQDVAMLVGDVPGAYAYSDSGNGVGYAYLSLRGFDQRRVAVYLDGVPLNTAETHQVYFVDLADLASGLEGVQVQRGAGTSLYGSPAVGGVVNLETASAVSLAGREISLTGGSFGTLRISGRYAASSRDGRWAWLVRGSRIASDGYRARSGTRHVLGQVALERYGARSALRFGAFGGPERTELAFAGVTADFLRGEVTGRSADDRRINFLHPGEVDRYTQPHLRLIHDLALTDRLTLRSTAYAVLGSGFYRQWSDSRAVAFGFDEERRPVDVRDVVGAWRRRAIDERRFGFIPRVRYLTGRGAIDAGLEVTFHRAHHDALLTDGVINGTPLTRPFSLYDYRTEKDSLTGFIRGDYALTSSLKVRAELQASTHAYALNEDASRGLSFAGRYSFLTPRVGLTWKASDRLGLYGSLSTARSEPAFRDIWDPQDVFVSPRGLFASASPGGTRFTNPKARPERLFDQEAGARVTAGRTKIRLGLYRMVFHDELVFSGGIDDDGNPLTTNAGKSLHQGMELEFRTTLGGLVNVEGFLSASRDRLRALTLVGVGEDGAPTTIDYSNNAIALFPKHLARLRVSRGFGRARLSIGARHVGRIHLDNSENERKTPGVRAAIGFVDKFIDPGLSLDAQASFELTRKLKLQAFVENLANRQYTSFGYAYPSGNFSNFYTEFFPAATRGLYFGASWKF